jgi:hypothetical protein
VRALMRLRRAQPNDADPRARMRLFVDLDDALAQSLSTLGIALAALAGIVALKAVGSRIPEAAVYVVAAATAGALAWWRREPLPAVAALVLAGWGWIAAMRSALDTGPLRADWGTLAAFTVAAIALGRLVELDASRERLARWVWLSGTLGTAALLFASSSRDIALRYSPAHQVLAGGWKHVALVALVLALCIASIVVARLRSALTNVEALALLGVLAALIVTSLPWASLAGAPDRSRVTRIMMVVPWALSLLGVTYALIRSAVARRDDRLVTLGIALGLLVALFEYGDWIYPHLDASVGLAVAGVLFIGLGFAAERGRRRVIAAMGDAHAEA